MKEKYCFIIFILFLSCGQQNISQQTQNEAILVDKNNPPPPKTDSTGRIIDTAYLAKLKKYEQQSTTFQNAIYFLYCKA